jgi:hypothetical protein
MGHIASKQAPLPRWIEVWTVDEDGACLKRAAGR